MATHLKNMINLFAAHRSSSFAPDQMKMNVEMIRMEGQKIQQQRRQQQQRIGQKFEFYIVVVYKYACWHQETMRSVK